MLDFSNFDDNSLSFVTPKDRNANTILNNNSFISPKD